MLHQKTLTQLAQGLSAGEYNSIELTQHFLDRIAAEDGAINSYITVTPETALAAATAADERRKNGDAGPLTGIPLAHKDIFCTQGIKTTCGSRMLDNFIAPYDATVVKKLAAAGMVTLGKTNLDEFAMGSTTESSHYGATKNPCDVANVPGGSSGGSAAAVAAQLAPIATGTDTGGSIRQPAALCGTFGIKPTYGRVSRWGMIAYASSLDQGGVISQTAEDAALMLGAMAGFDDKDSTSVDRPVGDYVSGLNNDLAGLKVGLPKEYFADGLDDQVAQKVHEAVKRLEAQGAEIKDISLPNVQVAVPAYYVIATSEASSNLSRYDGVRFGHRCDNPEDLTDLYKRSRTEGFGEEVKRRIMTGTFALSAGYYDAYYLKAQKLRRLIADDFKQAFAEVDVIASPVTPYVSQKLGEIIADPVKMYLGDIYTVSVNLAGLPGVSVPLPADAAAPVGLQLVGNYWQEARLLNVAHRLQQA